MAPLTAAAIGGLAGLVGAALAHALTVLLGRHGGAEWLHGPFGPPFFSTALYTGVFYAAIGGAAARRAGATAGLLGGFLGLAVPLYVLTRYGGFSPAAWHYAMLAVYAAALWGTIAWVGATAAPGEPLRGALTAMFGSLMGYAALTACLHVFHGLAQAAPGAVGPTPPFVTLLDGLLSGAGVCLVLSLDGRCQRRFS